MRFAVDAHALGRHLTGNEVYVRNLLVEFAGLDREAVFQAYVCRDSEDALQAIPQRIEIREVARNPFVRLGVDLSRQLRREPPDLVHVQYTAPLRCPVPIIATVHDVSFLEHPEYFPWARSRQLRLTVQRTVAQAARVIAPSEFSRRSILRAYDIAPERVLTIPNGVSRSFRPIAREVASRHVAARYGVASPYVLTVGDLLPRKNQIGLIRAFEELLRVCPSLPHHLLLVGKDTWYSSRIRDRAAASPAAHRIRLTGWVDDDDLLRLYNAADVFVFPSFYEGFGLPVLEAMACGTAVACSDRAALYEVADSCALTFNPDSTVDMVRCIRDLLLDGELRSRMARLGTQRASRFTWEEAARRTLDVYYEVVGASRPAHVGAAAPLKR